MRKYPQHEKLSASINGFYLLLEFLEWLQRNYGLINLVDDNGIELDTDAVIYQFLGIDRVAMKQESEQMTQDAASIARILGVKNG